MRSNHNLGNCRRAATGLIALTALLGGLVPERAEAAKRRRTAHGGDISTGKARKSQKAKQADKATCISFYDKASELRQRDHLLEARVLLAKCALSTCGSSLVRECMTLATTVAGEIPSVVPTVADAPPATAAQIIVRMNGDVLASKIDGKSIEVDPGSHHFTFSTDHGVFATEDVLIAKGQRDLPISTALPKESSNHDGSNHARSADAARAGQDASREAAQESPQVHNVTAIETGMSGALARNTGGDDDDARSSSRASMPSRDDAVGTRGRAGRDDRTKTGAPWGAYALGALGLAGVGGYAALTWKGRHDNDTLTQSCKPDCNPASMHYLRMVYLAADVSMGIGVVALGASTWLFLRSSSAEDRARTHVARVRAIDLHATRAGGFATIDGTF